MPAATLGTRKGGCEVKMICDKATICRIDCAEKDPHEKEIACQVECDWQGKCIPWISF